MGIGFLVEPQKRGKFHRNLYLPFIANVCNKDSEPDNKAKKRCRQGKTSPFARPRTEKRRQRPHAFLPPQPRARTTETNTKIKERTL